MSQFQGQSRDVTPNDLISNPALTIKENITLQLYDYTPHNKPYQ